MILGDLGADVIKVERPGSGDEARGWGPPFDAAGTSAYFLSANRNKLGIALDFDNDADRQVLRELVSGADVVLDNFRPGALERRSIVPMALLAAHPRLIWCSVTGFGADSARPGYDFVTQAEAGWMSVTGEPDGVPMKIGLALADILAGKDAAIAILGLLLRRTQSAEPLAPTDRRLHISLVASATAALGNVGQNALLTGADASRWGNAHANLVPYQLFRAADRHIVVAVGNDAQWAGACRALGLDALGRDETLSTNAGRVAARAQVVAAFAERLAERVADYWLGRLHDAGVPAGVVRTVREALSLIDASAVTGISPPVPGSVRLAPPRLDEHGALIRREGWSVFRGRSV